MVKEIIRRLIFKLFLLFRDRQESQIILLNDLIGLEILYNGFYEKSNLEALKKSFSSDVNNSTFLDIGANIGNHSIFFNNYFKNIKSFEPQKKIYEILKLNTQKYSNIETFNYGISTEDIFTSFNIPINNSGMASSKKLFKNYYTEKVSLKRLDFKKLPNVGYIKVDVEGEEFDVLKSLSEIIKASSPIISFELNSNNHDRKKIIDLMNNFGYYDFFVPANYKFQKNRIIRLFKSIFSKNLDKISDIQLLDSTNNFTLVSTFKKDSKYKLK